MRPTLHVRWILLLLPAITGAATSVRAEDPAGTLPPAHALDFAADDVDRDGHADLVYLCGGERPALRVFYGHATGYFAGRTESAPLVLSGARAATAGRLTIADLNNDGRPDMVVTAGGDAAYVYWNRFWAGRGNLREWSRTPLAVTNSTAAAVADYNRDGLLDLLIAGDDSIVFWGAATRTFVTHAPVRLADVGKKTVTVLPPAVAAPSSVPPAVPGAEHVVIHRESGRYAAFPSLCHLPGPNEALHVHFDTRLGRSHLEARRQEHNVVSTDGGRTWQRTPRRELNPAWRSRPGRLLHAEAYGWRYEPPGRRAALEAQGYEVREAPDGRVTYCAGCVLRVSDDDGATWRESEIAVPRQAIINSFQNFASTLRLDDRTMLCAIYGKPAARVRYYESWLLRTEDDGATWTFSTIAADPSRDDLGFSETALAQAADGDIVAMMRIEPSMGTRLWTARSSDRGRTWSAAVETPLRGFPAHVLRLRDGRLLCTYGHREQPIGIHAAISRDHGRTWRESDIVSLRSDGSGAPGDNGYPFTAELADGTFVTVYYLTRDGVTGVEATRWRNPWR